MAERSSETGVRMPPGHRPPEPPTHGYWSGRGRGGSKGPRAHFTRATCPCSPPYRPAGCRIWSKRAARANRGRASRHRTEQPSRWDRARSMAAIFHQTITGRGQRHRQSRKTSAGRAGISRRIGVWASTYDRPDAPIQAIGQLGGRVPSQRVKVLDIEVQIENVVRPARRYDRQTQSKREAGLEIDAVPMARVITTTKRERLIWVIISSVTPPT